MSDLDFQPAKIARTRRKLVKIGGIAISAVLAKLIKPTPALETIGFLRGTLIRTVESSAELRN
jgi:hypothetical protein